MQKPLFNFFNIFNILQLFHAAGNKWDYELSFYLILHFYFCLFYQQILHFLFLISIKVEQHFIRLSDSLFSKKNHHHLSKNVRKAAYRLESSVHDSNLLPREFCLSTQILQSHGNRFWNTRWRLQLVHYLLYGWIGRCSHSRWTRTNS